MTTTLPDDERLEEQAADDAHAATCDGCGRPLNPVEAQQWTVCLDCTKARQRAVASGRCACGGRAIPGELCRVGSRSWIPCRRCLGSIRQVT